MSSKQPSKKQNKRKKVKLVVGKEEDETTSQAGRGEEQNESINSEETVPTEEKVVRTEIDLSKEKEDSTKENKCGENKANRSSTIEGNVNPRETRIDILETKEEKVQNDNSKRMQENSSNPKITISEPVSSPNKQEPEPKSRCPIYYGIKSYIHDFYQPPDKEILKSGEYAQDDFQFLVEPGKRRWKNFWLRVALWLGVNLMLLGVIALLVGHLTSPRPTTLPLPLKNNVAMVDKWAVEFNNRLIICQLAGLAAFTSGAVVVMLALLVYSYQNQGYYVMAATVMPEAMLSSPQAGPYLSRIPLTGSVRGVQPTFVRTE